jgi:hypothetical protein
MAPSTSHCYLRERNALIDGICCEWTKAGRIESLVKLCEIDGSDTCQKVVQLLWGFGYHDECRSLAAKFGIEKTISWCHHAYTLSESACDLSDIESMTRRLKLSILTKNQVLLAEIIRSEAFHTSRGQMIGSLALNLAKNIGFRKGIMILENAL